MTSLALLFTLAAIGISETVYLVRARIAGKRLVCPIGEGCTTVLTSRYSAVFFIPNDVLGLVAYIIIAIGVAFLVIGVPPIDVWQSLVIVVVGIASAMSLLLVYLQWRVIRAWCFWCLISAFTIWLMGIIIML